MRVQERGSRNIRVEPGNCSLGTYIYGRPFIAHSHEFICLWALSSASWLI